MISAIKEGISLNPSFHLIIKSPLLIKIHHQNDIKNLSSNIFEIGSKGFNGKNIKKVSIK